MSTISGTTKREINDWADVLAEVPLFAGLSKRHVKAIAKLAKVQRVPQYSQIVGTGEAGDSFYLVLDGTAIVRPPRKRAITLGMGDFFGELALLDDSPRTATVEAGEDLLVARIGRKSFLKMLETEPKVSLALLRTLSGRLRASESTHTH